MNLPRALVVGACLVCANVTFAQTKTKSLGVCADPQNMPFSNRSQEGFENKIADLLAKALGTTTRYVWWGQRQGFIRNTMNATLEEGRCEVVVAVPKEYDLVLTSRPYFRSTYVFVYPRDKGPRIKSLDDPVLKKLKIGVHLLGNDYENPPPVHELSKRGVVGNLVGFNTFYSAENPSSAIIDAVASGKVDVAIVWGPAAGYFVQRQRVPLVMVPVPSAPGDLPFAFDISMGVKPGNTALLKTIEQVIDAKRVEIERILTDYNIPLLERKAIPKP